MAYRGEFKQSLVRMLQIGTFEEMVGCQKGECTRVEFQLQTSYDIHLTRHTIVVEERDTEIIRRQVRGRWQRLGPTSVSKNRLIVERGTGKILQSPRLGVARSVVNARGRRQNQRKVSALAGTA